MATIKSLLDAALKASSTNAFTSGTRISIATFTAPWDWEQGQKFYTPPSDGHLYFDTPFASGLMARAGDYCLYLTNAATDQVIRYHYAYLPVKKGVKISLLVFLRSGATSETSTVYFCPCKGQA